jgi:peptide/nickel transport system substrate-binding protein
MKLTSLRRIAFTSFALVLASADAARRPRYGGELRFEMRAIASGPESLDPAVFEGAIFETLVRLDERGLPMPWLATSWKHDEARKRWVFSPRANVMLHNGAVWSPGPLEFPDDKPIDQILRELARGKNAVIVRSEDGAIAGTGPFRVDHWEAGKNATLVAHDAYWGGRPFLDSVRITMGRALRDQTVDLEVGNADVVESALRPRGIGYTSAPAQVFALQFEERVPAAVREAVGLSIDRMAINNVLLQKTGEISGALLPRWLSGYSFLFSTERNLARARQLAPGTVLTFSYDRQDPLIRAIAERIAVNASEAGVTLRPAAGPGDVRGGDVHVVMFTVTSRDAWTALDDITAFVKSPFKAQGNLYEAERSLLVDARLTPLFHLPQTWAMSSRVRNWPQLADVWLDLGAKP